MPSQTPLGGLMPSAAASLSVCSAMTSLGILTPFTVQVTTSGPHSPSQVPCLGSSLTRILTLATGMLAYQWWTRLRTLAGSLPSCLSSIFERSSATPLSRSILAVTLPPKSFSPSSTMGRIDSSRSLASLLAPAVSPFIIQRAFIQVLWGTFSMS